MNQNRDHRRTWHCIGATCLLVLVGCGQSARRQALEGTVTLDGSPLAEGNIAFRPLPGSSSPSAGGTITAGTFSIAGKQGPCQGTFRVEISAPRKVKQQFDSHVSAMVDVYEETIPPQYNSQSTLTAEVKIAGTNRFEFALKSK